MDPRHTHTHTSADWWVEVEQSGRAKDTLHTFHTRGGSTHQAHRRGSLEAYNSPRCIGEARLSRERKFGTSALSCSLASLSQSFSLNKCKKRRNPLAGQGWLHLETMLPRVPFILVGSPRLGGVERRLGHTFSCAPSRLRPRCSERRGSRLRCPPSFACCTVRAR